MLEDKTLDFVYESLPSRVVFGTGSIAKLSAEVERLGATRALVLCTPEQRAVAEQVVVALGSRAAGVFDRAVMHVPIETAEAAREEARRMGADCCVAVGGGSTTGLAKAIALTSDLPILAVPTTYAGSEMTPIWGLTEAGVKRTGRDVRVLPKTVIYDPHLTLTLASAFSATSGMNAIAHGVEALYAKDANPIISLLAEDAIRSLAQSLPVIVRAPSDVNARSRALYGAWLAGVALGNVGMALHHKLCHTLGGSFGLPHAEVHTVVLPHAVAYNAAGAPEAMARLRRALGGTTLGSLTRSLGAPTSLREIGMREEDLDRAADLAVQNPYYNPVPVTREGVRKLLQAAYLGMLGT